MTSHRWRALGEVHIAPPIAPTPRSFGLTVGGALAAIALFSLWRHHIVRTEIAAAVAAVLLIAALIRPASLAPLARGWGRVGHLLGWVNSRILLTVLFALVLWPIEDAYQCFMRTSMDALVLESFVLLKDDQPKTADEGAWQQEFALD